jgi:hypothetical protein
MVYKRGIKSIALFGWEEWVAHSLLFSFLLVTSFLLPFLSCVLPGPGWIPFPLFCPLLWCVGFFFPFGAHIPCRYDSDGF